MKLIEGKSIANKINESVKQKIVKLSCEKGKRPKLVSLMAGDGKDAEIYINMQKRAAEYVGIDYDSTKIDSNATSETLIEIINDLNADANVSSIIVQKPLPKGVFHDRIVSNVLPIKDAEGVHPFNLGKIYRHEADIVPCTPGAVMKILRVLEIDLYGKEVVIIGHSAIVGKPLSLMLLNEMATTTVAHLGTYENGSLLDHTKKADILIVAVGKPEMVKSDWVKNGVIVVDVGINNVGNTIVGDVDFEQVSPKASHITPVPGGVGPITVSILMRNVLRSFLNQNV